MGRVKARLPELNVGLVHGRMKPAEKQAVMQSFKQGELHLLVATTVIEVGVDVPNSSLMIIENPERTGRRSSTSYEAAWAVARSPHCVLLYKAPLSKTAQMRLQVLRDSNDGFVIAQKIWRSAARVNCWARVRRVTPNLKWRICCAIRP